uniref:UPF0606 protein KIAA1549-like n=1 Tax=Stegastes partitus TaxID=144197 RepID=A0A3B5BBP0_9TELE
MGRLGDVPDPPGSSPSALPDSHYTAFESPDSPGALPSAPQPIHEARTADTMLFQSEHNSKSNTPRDALTEEPHALTTPSLSPPEPVLGSGPQFEAPAKLSTDWKISRTNSDHKLSSLSPTPTSSQPHPEFNESLISLSPSASTGSTPQRSPNSEQKAASSKQQGGDSEQTLAIMTSEPGQPSPEPPNLTFAGALADEFYSKLVDVNQLSPSSAPLEENKRPHVVNMRPNQDEILSPGYNVPFIAPHPSSPSSEPTEVSPEDFYPTNTMELDWGSGDYLETMSFFDTDRDDYSLVTKVPSDSYDLEDYTETYDTSFPSRVGISPSSLYPLHVSPSLSLAAAYSTVGPLKSIYPSSFSTTVQFTLEPTPTADSDIPDLSDIDWPDTFTIQPTDVLLPDMNSLEYYTTQLSKENNGSEAGAEHRGNVTVVSISSTDITPTSGFTNDTKLAEDESSSDLSGFEPHDESTPLVTTEESPVLVNASEPFLDPSIVPNHFLDPSSTMWGGPVSATDWSLHSLTASLDRTAVTEPVRPSATPLLPDDVISPSSLTDVHWFVTESFPTGAFSPVPTEPAVNDTEFTPQDSTFTTEQTLVSTESTSHNVTVAPPVVLGDQGVTEDGVDVLATVTLIPTTATTSKQYLCDLDRPTYLIRIGKFEISSLIRLCHYIPAFSVKVVDPPPKFVFRVVSGPVVYTAISVINALRRSGRRFLSVSPSWTTPDRKYQVHSVLQFVPGHIDVRFCNFSESIEKGLTMAFAEVRRRSKESTNFTVHIVNITMAPPKYEDQRVVRQPVDITFTVRGSRGYLTGSEVSNALMKLTMVEFSYYMGFPVLQIAEPFHYPELNTSQLLRSSWVRTVLLGVLDQKVNERTFQANMERRVAMLLGEAMGLGRRVKRATVVGNSSVQVQCVVSASRLVGADHPLEIVYFVEGPSGQRMPADQTANLLNNLDVQRAAIVLGYRVQGILAQPVEKVASSPSDTENTNMWVVIGVVIPLLVVIVIISILYWKLCRTDKLEFQPDAMTSIQQRQKLQAPSVKGFDFAKLHLGQQSKDDVMVIQESVPPGPGPGPLPVSIKDGLSPSENGEIPTPISKASLSSTKASRSSRRVSPSDGDSVVSDHSSERESTEENLRAHATPSDGPPPMNGTSEQLSSASIFEHVDRMSRATDASRRLPNKVQLIAMQPMPVPPLHSPPINGKLSDTNQINKEIQVALRHKSEIEHHRNKIRLRAKRKGHYDFPAMDDMVSGLGDAKDQDRIYQKAQTQIDKILDPDAQMPSIFMEHKKSARGRRSPKQRMKDHLNGGMMEADKDHLITDDSDAVYRKCPGVNNVAYVVGPGSPHRSPSPTDDVFLAHASSPPGHAPPPPPYMPPQPSIEEARQQMHSLLDDAFALVSPTSQGSTAGITLPGVNSNPPGSSPPGRGPRPWGPSYQSLFSPCFGPCSGPCSSLFGPCFSPCSVPQLQPDSLYSSRGLYTDELPSSARPRPVGGTTGAQLHHLTQVGLSSRMNGFPAGVRAAPGQNGGIGWSHYHDDNFSRVEPEKDFLECPEHSSSSIFQMHRGGLREPTAPPAHLDVQGVGYLTAPPPLDTSPPTHSSASLIKAIREELLRLSQKQAAVPSYHS